MPNRELAQRSVSSDTQGDRRDGRSGPRRVLGAAGNSQAVGVVGVGSLFALGLLGSHPLFVKRLVALDAKPFSDCHASPGRFVLGAGELVHDALNSAPFKLLVEKRAGQGVARKGEKVGEGLFHPSIVPTDAQESIAAPITRAGGEQAAMLAEQERMLRS